MNDSAGDFFLASLTARDEAAASLPARTSNILQVSGGYVANRDEMLHFDLYSHDNPFGHWCTSKPQSYEARHRSASAGFAGSLLSASAVPTLFSDPLNLR